MNYNDYDSNGNKKRFNIVDIASDKQKRSILILCFYLIIFIMLVVFVRVSISGNGNSKNQDDKKNVQEEIIEEEPRKKDEIDNMFSFIDNNNYDFKFTINYDGIEYIVKGKRFEDKYSFIYTNGVDTLTFLGTTNSIKYKSDSTDYTTTVFPYILINYFDNNILKDIIRNSLLIDNKYTITNENIFKMAKLNKEVGEKDSINTIELVTKNNNVVGINIDISNAVSEFEKKETKVFVGLEYENFGLIDDFELIFE